METFLYHANYAIINLMTPMRARLTLFAFAAIFLATARNALVQDRARLIHADGLPSADVSVTQFPLNGASQLQTDPPPSVQPNLREPRLLVALQRELSRRGYASQGEAAAGLRLAVLAYEFDNGLPLTGEPTEALLKRVLFDLNQAPRGAFADRAENNPKLVLDVQKRLLELGFFRGTLSGRMDIWTASGIKDFERYVGLALTGRLNETTLLQLISYSGQPLQAPTG